MFFDLIMLGCITVNITNKEGIYTATFDGVPDGTMDILSGEKQLSGDEFKILFDKIRMGSKDTNEYSVDITHCYTVEIFDVSGGEQLNYSSDERHNFSPSAVQSIMDYIAKWGGIWENLAYNIVG